MGDARRVRKPPIPLTLVTGPIGAGKTRLVNRLMQHAAFAGTAVILNEFGATELAGGAAETADDGFVALGGGCVCCSVRGELVGALERLLRANDNGRLDVDRVVIETEAAADPAAVLVGVMRHPYLSMRYRPAGVVVVLPADAAIAGLEAPPLALQVASADLAVTPPGGSGDEATEALARINGFAAVAPADAVDPASVTDFPFWEGRLARPPARIGPPKETFVTLDLARPGGLCPADVARLVEDVALKFGRDLARLLLVSGKNGACATARIFGGAILPGETSGTAADAKTHVQAVLRQRSPDDLVDLLDIHLGGVRVDRPDRAAHLDNPLAIAGFSARPGRR